MGFSSFKCSVSRNSIPAYPHADMPAVLSHVVLVLPCNRTIKGHYDGYGRVDGISILQLVEPYLPPMPTFGDYHRVIKLVRVDHYTGQTYEQLPLSLRCEHQGFFYPKTVRTALINSIKGGSNE
jgi:hypothetical protein